MRQVANIFTTNTNFKKNHFQELLTFEDATTQGVTKENLVGMK